MSRLTFARSARVSAEHDIIYIYIDSTDRQTEGTEIIYIFIVHPTILLTPGWPTNVAGRIEIESV